MLILSKLVSLTFLERALFTFSQSTILMNSSLAFFLASRFLLTNSEDETLLKPGCLLIKMSGMTLFFQKLGSWFGENLQNYNIDPISDPPKGIYGHTISSKITEIHGTVLPNLQFHGLRNKQPNTKSVSSSAEPEN